MAVKQSWLYLTSTTVLLIASHLHLMLVTFEMLAAIKFTMHYQSFITNDNLKMAVSAIWSSAFMCGVFTVLKMNLLLQFIGSLITSSCIFFVALTYVILYHEIRRHQRKIKTQQLPQEEVERFIKESKALKTTLFIVVQLSVTSFHLVSVSSIQSLAFLIHAQSTYRWCKHLPC